MMDVDMDGENNKNDERPLYQSKAKITRRPGVKVSIKETVETTNKTTLIDQHNFCYRRNKARGGLSYWMCKHAKCPVKGVVDDTEPGSVTLRGVHSHLSNACGAEALILQSKVIRQAVENPTVQPRTLYSDLVSTQGVHEDVVMSFTSQHNLAQQIHRERAKVHVTQCREPKSFLELVENMPECLKVTNRGDKLLSYTGYADEGNEAKGFMVFASRFGIDLLSRSDT